MYRNNRRAGEFTKAAGRDRVDRIRLAVGPRLLALLLLVVLAAGGVNAGAPQTPRPPASRLAPSTPARLWRSGGTPPLPSSSTELPSSGSGASAPIPPPSGRRPSPIASGGSPGIRPFRPARCSSSPPSA